MLNMTKEEKLKKLKGAIKTYNKEAEKKGIKSVAGFVKDIPGFGKVELVKTGIYKLDKLIGGIPRGRYTQIFGPSSAGKSTLVNAINGSFQKQDLTTSLANNERNWEEQWAILQGINIDDLIGGNFSDLEECLNFCIDMAETGACDSLTIDTITAISSKQEQFKKKNESMRSLDDDTMALIPRKLSQFFRMATAKINDSNMIVILVNQVRADITGYGGGMDAPGGNALKHNQSLNLRVTRSKCQKAGFDKSHYIMKITVMKSKILEAQEGSFCECYFRLGKGIDNNLDIIMDAVDEGLIEKSAGWYKYNDIKEQGYDKFVTKLEVNNLIDQIKNKLLGETIGSEKNEKNQTEKAIS